MVAHGNRGVQLRRRRRVRDSFCYPLRQRSAENSRATSGSGIHTLAPKDLEIASQKQNAPGHSWNDSLGACSPLPRAREKVWWAVRGRNQILDLVPRIGKHHSFSRVLAYYWGTIPRVAVGWSWLQRFSPVGRGRVKAAWASRLTRVPQPDQPVSPGSAWRPSDRIAVTPT